MRLLNKNEFFIIVKFEYIFYLFLVFIKFDF